MSSLTPYVLVAVGGSLGALARFVLARWVGLLVETRFPLGTFVINISGSFLLGIVGTLVAEKVFPGFRCRASRARRRFSRCIYDLLDVRVRDARPLEDGSWLTATTNMFVSLFLGLIAVRAGIVAAKAWLV